MATSDEIKDLKEKNNELAQKVQYWKMTAAEKENEKLNLMKELNELRLKYSRLKNTGRYEARKLDSSLQQASEKAITHLVNASAEIARGMEIAKAYIRDRQEQEAQSPRWSSLGGTPVSERTDKVHRVPPMMMGGQSIQPVVALSRTLLNTSNPVTASRSPTQNRSVTERALPMHMLQDVYIPLTRIDISDLPNNNMEADADTNNATDSTEDLGLDDSDERTDERGSISEEDEELCGRRLDALSEEENETEEIESPRLALRLENPLEGPSWLLDSPPDSSSSNSRTRANLEPDSTTELDKTPKTKTCSAKKSDDNAQEGSSGVSVRVSCEFSPTVRRRKRASSPPTPSAHYSPRPPSCRKSVSTGRVLKVLVAKMRLGSDGEVQSPPKRARSPRDPLLAFDAPSPNGATDSAVIVSETRTQLMDQEIKSEPGSPRSVREPQETHRSRLNSQDPRSSQPRLSQDSPRLSRESRTGHARLSQDSRTTHPRQSQETHEPRTKPREEGSRRHNSQDSVVRGRGLSEQLSRMGSVDSRDSDSGSGGQGDSISEGRTRRPRKMITYKEKPLNRKLRR